MDGPRFQLRVSTLLGLVACVAVNVWLFRLGWLLGFLGLNVSKHVAIAYLCQLSGVNRRTPPRPPVPVRNGAPSLAAPHLPRQDPDRARP